MTMIPATTTSEPADPRETLAPGLLTVLQQAAALRLVLFVIAGSLFMALSLAERMPKGSWLGVLGLAEAAIFLVFVLWSRVRQALGVYFLPVALGWFMLAPFIEQAVFLSAEGSTITGSMGRAAFAGVGVETIWLGVPVILAAWQYGRRGWLLATAGIVAGQIVLGLAVAANPVDLGNYVLISMGRTGTIALLGYIIVRLAASLQNEHQALVGANRELARRAATAEQLAESRERNRLARELHDTLAHSLTGLSVQLQAVETLLDYDPEAARSQLKDAQATVRTGAQEARRSIQWLRATPLEDLGLAEALRQLCRRYAGRTGISFACAIDDVAVLDPLTEQTVYRVAEESLSNIVQHASARTVRLGLSMSSGGPTLRLEVEDDGVGFDPAAVADDRFGLAGMRERAALVGGRLQVESKPGQGARLILEVGV